MGCGTLVMEERLVACRSRFVGLDLTEDMLRFGQSKALPNIAILVRGDAEDLPFPDGAFDSVVSCYVAKYVAVDRFAEEIARVAKPGAVIAVYDFDRPKGLLSPFLELYIQVGLRVIGTALAALRSDAAFAFIRLPEIVDKTRWAFEVVGAMEKAGIETTATERLTGGVVFAFCGRKRGRPFAEAGVMK